MAKTTNGTTATARTAPPKIRCFACRTYSWYHKDIGGWICRVCHPLAGQSKQPPPPELAEVSLKLQWQDRPAAAVTIEDGEEAAEVAGAFACYQEHRRRPYNAAEWAQWWPQRQTVEVDPALRGKDDFDTLELKAYHAWASYLQVAPTAPLAIPGTQLRVHIRYLMSGPTMPWLNAKNIEGPGNAYALTIPGKGWCKNLNELASVMLVGWIPAEELQDQARTYTKGEGEKAVERYGVPADELQPPQRLQEIVKDVRRD